MRKLVLIILLLILLILSLVSRGLAEMGIKTGINKTDLHFSIRIPNVSFDSRSTWLIGLFYAFNISKHVTLQPEIFYAQKGGISKETFSKEVITINHKLSYIEIPLLVKFKIPNKSFIKPLFFFGPYAAYCLNAKAEQTAFRETEEIDLEKYIKKWDFGLVFGAGLEFNLKGMNFLVDARYSFGFTNIARNYDEIYYEFTESDFIKNSAFVILIGAGF